MSKWSHLTDNEHVLSSNDALLHLGAQSPANVLFVLIAVGSVNVAVSCCNGCLHCTLRRAAWKVGRLQEETTIKSISTSYTFTELLNYLWINKDFLSYPSLLDKQQLKGLMNLTLFYDLDISRKGHIVKLSTARVCLQADISVCDIQLYLYHIRN